jgi:hypothetical protein
MKKLLPEACKECIKESANACKLCRQKHISDLQDLKNFNNDLIDKCAELEKQLDNIKYLDRDNLQDTFVTYAKEAGTGATKQSVLFLDSEAFNNAINAICNLALPAEEKIIEVLKGYFYSTIDKSVDIYNDTPNVVRLYSQREIETEEDFMTDKLREEISNEFKDIAKALLGGK